MKTRKILHYDEWGNVIGSFDSIIEAAIKTGLTPGSIKYRAKKYPEEWVFSKDTDEILDVVVMIDGNYYKTSDGRSIPCNDTYIDENNKIRRR